MPAADRGEKFQRDARGDGEDAFVGKNDGSIIFESLGFQFTLFTHSLSLSLSLSLSRARARFRFSCCSSQRVSE